MRGPDPSSPTRTARRDWNAEYAALSEADRAGGLSPEDLEQLAVAAFLLGRDGEVTVLRERAYEQYLERDEVEKAVRCGFWLGFHLQNAGKFAQASGWQARLRRLIDDDPDDHYAALFAMPDAVRAMWAGDATSALPTFERATRVAAAVSDLDMFALAGVGRGSCLQLLGRCDEASAVLDEVMLHVVAGQVAPQVTGLAYCAVIGLAMQRFDVRRAQEWTEALGNWLAGQAGVIPYRGVCQVHRAEILQQRGAWSQAAAEADRACSALALSRESALGAAHYRVAELARLRGEPDAAERAYEQAAAHGHEVQPGLARLRLAQGRPDAAAAGLDRALAEQPASPARSLLLAARIDVALAGDDLDTAQSKADELCRLAAEDRVGYVRVLAEQYAGAVLLAAGDARGALPRLRFARSSWQELDAPYETAQARLLIARTCAALGDDDAAAMEADAACEALRELGATADLAALDDGPHSSGPLSARELQVLRLLATGATNRAIAERLVLSEKTVARHVSNIFAKLGVANRSAATAYAYEHGLA